MMLLCRYDGYGFLVKVDVGILANSRLKSNSNSDNYKLIIILTTKNILKVTIWINMNTDTYFVSHSALILRHVLNHGVFMMYFYA